MPVIDEKQELAKKADLATKQDTLIPGTNITIAADGKTISAAGGGSTVSVTPVLSTGTRIAAMEVDGTIYTLFAPTPPSVEVTQIQQSGVELARVTIDNIPYSIYAPEGSTVLSGTSAPTAAEGENGDLYVQYTVTSGVYTVNMTYVKLSGAWVELAASGSEVEPNPQETPTDTLNTLKINDTVYEVGSGGSGLPENYTPTPLSLQIESPSDCNELGWGIIDDIYYFDTAASWTVGDRTFTKDNATPALGAVFQPSNSQWYHSYLLSTNADATGFYCTGYGPNRQKYSFEYNGHTWYYSGGEYSLTNASVSGIEVVSEYSDSEFSSFLKHLINQSEVYFDDYANTITHVGTPASGVLFAGGGEEADLSDATFKVTAEGDIIGNAFHGATTLANGSVGLVPAPLIADKDKFLKGDGTWTNAGGNGNVDDVYVNGTSVLDSDKIAQITSYKEVTQAEYDALPASKESDNVLYCIKDKATADTTVAPIIYSEEEREVGVWTDGKPLYQRTLFYTGDTLITVSGDSSSTYSVTGITDIYVNDILPTLDQLIHYQIDLTFDGNEKNIYHFEYCFQASTGTFIRSHNPGIAYIGYNITPGSSITLQYTKTTDQPGSGKYAPSGVPAVHYSENEQVVGTWIDGSTLYERTYTDISFEGTSDTTIVDANIKSNSGIYNVKSITGLWAIGNFGYLDATIQAFGETGIFNGGSQTLYARVTPNGLAVVRTNTNFGYGAFLTIRYTKSTS